MSPRPRTMTNGTILDATRRVIARTGPADVTLAAIGREAGIAPATLIQRFGSKQELLRAASRDAQEGTAARFRTVRKRSRAALGAVRRILEDMVAPDATPDGVLNRLAAHQLHLRDAASHRYALAQARALRRGLGQLLDEAVERGELRPCNTRQLARTTQVVAAGALITWTVHREGRARRYLRNRLDALFAPLRAPMRRSRLRRKAR